MITVNTHEAKTRLSALLKAVEEQNEVPQWETSRGIEGASQVGAGSPEN